MLSQAKKLPALTAISAAVSDAERARTALCEAYSGLVEVELDINSGLFSVDADKLAALNRREFGVSSNVDIGAVSAVGAVDVLMVGPWRIQAQLLPSITDAVDQDSTSVSAIANGCKTLSSLAAVLPGTFTYDLPLPLPQVISSDASTEKVHLSFHFQLEQLRSHAEELTLYSDLCDQLQRGLSITSAASSVSTTTSTTIAPPQPSALPSYEEVQALCREVVAPTDLLQVVDRLRHGLPLLVLRNKKNVEQVGASDSGVVGAAGSVVRFTFTYK